MLIQQLKAIGCNMLGNGRLLPYQSVLGTHKLWQLALPYLFGFLSLS
jgi:hypothetical protein